MKIYIDCEFDALWTWENHIQCVIAIGAVACDETGKECGRFYSLVCPKRFKRISSVVRRMTQLNSAEIREAASFSVVMKQFQTWLKQFQTDKGVQLYSFGPDDKRTILQHATYEKYQNIAWAKEIKDLQKILSGALYYKEKQISSSLSLDDLKQVYEIEGEVIHNALHDALDLMHIHQAMLQGNCNEARLLELGERKEAKQLEIKQREKERMLSIIKTKYERHHEKTYVTKMYPAIIEQLMMLEERCHPFAIMFCEDQMRYEQERYSYDTMTLQMKWWITVEQPTIEVIFQTQHKDIVYTLELNYKIANLLDSISRSASKSKTA